jgi:molybdopterin molybdotransferase
MISPEEALDLVVQAAKPCPTCATSLANACGRSLAEAIHADRDHPPFDRAMMDGFAVRLSDAGRIVPVVGEIPAGCVWQPELACGQCLEIMTGAACPAGTEAVVKKEDVERCGNEVRLPTRIELGQHIAPQGSECRGGQQVLTAGEVVTPLAVAAMAAVGISRVQVVRQPRVGVITTGSELAPPGRLAVRGQIRDSNAPMLVAMAEGLGIKRPRHLRTTDRLELIAAALDRFAEMDIVLLSGGVSVGTYDMVPKALAEYGAEVIFRKVKQKPGKPLLLARKDRQLLFGLPGNPMGCHLSFHRYVAAAIRGMAGRAAAPRVFWGELPKTSPLPQAREGPGVRAAGMNIGGASIDQDDRRTHFVPARAEHATEARSSWQITLLPGLSSADIFRTHRANCYVELPPGRGAAQAGVMLPFTWLGGAEWSD